MNKHLVTQGELRNTVIGLGALADNLNEHTNSSLSKSHGWTGMKQLYQNSAGCIHSGPASAPAQQRIVRVVVGEQIYYAPAQLSAGIDGEPDVVLTSDTGVISPQQADPALDLTVGSPVASCLVTSFASQLNVVAGSADTALLTHAGSPPETAHGGLSAEPHIQIDSAGHVVGRYGVNLIVNGRRWRIVCDRDRRGPPQAARFANPIPQIIDYYTSGGSFTSVSAGRWFDYAPSGAGQATYVAELVVQGTPPLLYQWEYSANLTDWYPVITGGFYQVNGGFSFSVLPSSHIAGANWITLSPSGTITAEATSTTVLRVAAADGGSSDQTRDPAYALRLTVDNSAIGGAVVHSEPLILAMKDETGGC
jgi:hypothetical protein